MTTSSSSLSSPRKNAAQLTEQVTTGPYHSFLARIWSVVQLHLVDRRTYLGIPWLIVGITFVISVVISYIIGFATGQGVGGVESMEGQRYSWAVLAPQWYLIVVAVQTISFGFPFALGFSVTRREFYFGTSLLFVLISAFNSVAFTLLVQIEKPTHGWFLGIYMFNALWFGLDAWYVDLLSFFVMQMLVFFVGASVATVYMRWRMPGMLVFWVSFAFLLLGTIALITYTSSWPIVVSWLVAQGTAGIFAWLLVPTAIAALGGFLALRRATPKN